MSDKVKRMLKNEIWQKKKDNDKEPGIRNVPAFGLLDYHGRARWFLGAVQFKTIQEIKAKHRVFNL